MVVVLGLFPASLGGAQKSGSAQTPPLRSATELVKLDTSVLDQGGKFVAGLTVHDFRVLDNGIEQPVVFFSPVQTPAQILVMLETSPAVYLIQNEHIASAYALVDALAPDDQVALATYAATPHGILGFTEDKSALLAALGQVQYTIGMGELNLYNSISTVLDWLKSSTGEKGVGAPQYWTRFFTCVGLGRPCQEAARRGHRYFPSRAGRFIARRAWSQVEAKEKSIKDGWGTGTGISSG